MRVLAFDTCLGALSVAVRHRAANGAIRRHAACERRETGHAEALMPMVERILAESGLAVSEVDRIAVTRGPGTFTGVRIGVAAARGFALATGLPIVAATSLEVMAAGACGELAEAALAGPLVVAVDARRDRHYVQAFAGRWDRPSGPPRLLETDAVAAGMGLAEAMHAVVVGSGASAVAAAAGARGLAWRPALPDLQPNAAVLAEMAEFLAPALPLEPLYIRAPDAKPSVAGALHG